VVFKNDPTIVRASKKSKKTKEVVKGKKTATAEAPRQRKKSDGKYAEAVAAALSKLKAMKPGAYTTRDLAEKYELAPWAFKAAGHKLERDGRATMKNKDRVNTVVLSARK
jgi:hypothetical protein